MRHLKPNNESRVAIELISIINEVIGPSLIVLAVTTYEGTKTSHKKVREKVANETYFDSLKLSGNRIVRTANTLLVTSSAV